MCWWIANSVVNAQTENWNFEFTIGRYVSFNKLSLIFIFACKGSLQRPISVNMLVEHHYYVHMFGYIGYAGVRTNMFAGIDMSAGFVP